jgi:hypothetical protein
LCSPRGSAIIGHAVPPTALIKEQRAGAKEDRGEHRP